MGAKATVRTVSPEELVKHYLPGDYEFGSEGANHNYEVPALPALKLTGVKSNGTEKVECDIPEGSSMFIYAHYLDVKTGKTIAVIFSPANDVQIKIVAGGIVVVRRF